MAQLLHSGNAVSLICKNVTFHMFFSITFICSHLLAQKICTQSATVIYTSKLKCKTSWPTTLKFQIYHRSKTFFTKFKKWKRNIRPTWIKSGFNLYKTQGTCILISSAGLLLASIKDQELLLGLKPEVGK